MPVIEPNQVWTGYYVCSQGRTSLKLRIIPVSDLSVKAIFDFNFSYGKAVGEFYLHGKYNPKSRNLEFRPGPDGHFKIPHLWPGQNPPATA
jgi:hypothetical protein